MSAKEFLKKASEQLLDISPVLPEGVRIVTREKSALERSREDRPAPVEKNRD